MEQNGFRSQSARGNFDGSFDQLILDALLETQDAEIAFSPGFRWGTSILPGEPITFEDVMNMTAITYPYVTNNVITGEQLKNLLEDICHNLFNPDPYCQQGGDMVRVGGLQYACEPTQKIVFKINNLRLNEKPIDASRSYKLSGWAPVGNDVNGRPVWEVLTDYLRGNKTVKAPKLNRPQLADTSVNPGFSKY